MSIALLQGTLDDAIHHCRREGLRPDLVFADPAWVYSNTGGESKHFRGTAKKLYDCSPMDAVVEALREAYEVAADDAYCVVDFTFAQAPEALAAFWLAWERGKRKSVIRLGQAGEIGARAQHLIDFLGLAKVARKAGDEDRARELDESAQWALDEIRRLSNLRGPFDRPTWRPLTGGAWLKIRNTPGVGHHLRSECEPWLVLTKGSPSPVHSMVPNFGAAPARPRTEKPIELVLPIVEGYCRRGLLSLWTGTGPELEAAARLGLWAVGAEPDPEVCAATVARVRRAVKSPIPLRPPPVIIPHDLLDLLCPSAPGPVTSPKCRGQLLADTLERAIDAERRWAPEGWEEPTTWAKCLGELRRVGDKGAK